MRRSRAICTERLILLLVGIAAASLSACSSSSRLSHSEIAKLCSKVSVPGVSTVGYSVTAGYAAQALTANGRSGYPWDTLQTNQPIALCVHTTGQVHTAYFVDSQGDSGSAPESAIPEKPLGHL